NGEAFIAQPSHLRQANPTAARALRFGQRVVNKAPAFIGRAEDAQLGGWVGLSEVTWLGDERFAILERDNQPGDYAVIKTVTTIDLAGVEPAALDGDIPVVEKQLAIDLLPIMQATNGWISDKPEGIAITADGQVFMVSDNDALDDATGETQFLNLGDAGSLF
ncbi:MAG: esterase-like activity of phytase family protein, partial [Pseudomonadota bacterium]